MQGNPGRKENYQRKIINGEKIIIIMIIIMIMIMITITIITVAIFVAA